MVWKNTVTHWKQVCTSIYYFWDKPLKQELLTIQVRTWVCVCVVEFFHHIKLYNFENNMGYFAIIIQVARTLLKKSRRKDAPLAPIFMWLWLWTTAKWELSNHMPGWSQELPWSSFPTRATVSCGRCDFATSSI